jgi:hypothetical protein
LVKRSGHDVIGTRSHDVFHLFGTVLEARQSTKKKTGDRVGALCDTATVTIRTARAPHEIWSKEEVMGSLECKAMIKSRKVLEVEKMRKS